MYVHSKSTIISLHLAVYYGTQHTYSRLIKQIYMKPNEMNYSTFREDLHNSRPMLGFLVTLLQYQKTNCPCHLRRDVDPNFLFPSRTPGTSVCGTSCTRTLGRTWPRSPCLSLWMNHWVCCRSVGQYEKGAYN